MTQTTRSREVAMRGVAPVIIILAIVLIGAVSYAVVNRNVLKQYFETGDKPTQEQFGTVIDSDVSKNSSGDSTADQSAEKDYAKGDTVVHSQAIYQARVLTEDQKEFKLDTDQSVTFRWTPVVPKPQEPVTYRLKVWQLMQGQNSTQAMRTNPPIVTKDVDNMTETTVANIYTGPCKPPYLCDFIWSVDVVTNGSVDTGAKPQ